MKRLLTLFAAAALACAGALPAQAQTSTENALAVSCENNGLEVFANSPNARLRCEASGLPKGEKYVYEWLEKVNGEWNHAVNVTNRHNAKPNFIVPKYELRERTKYEFLFTARSQDRSQYAFTHFNVYVNPPLRFRCGKLNPIPEGSKSIGFPCDISTFSRRGGYGLAYNSKYGKPQTLSYHWKVRGNTPAEAINLLSDTYQLNPTFTPPANVDKDTRYKYQLTIFDRGKETAKRNVAVTVLDAPAHTGHYTIIEPFSHTYNEQDSTVTVTGSVQATNPTSTTYSNVDNVVILGKHDSPPYYFGNSGRIPFGLYNHELAVRLGQIDNTSLKKVNYSGHIKEWCQIRDVGFVTSCADDLYNVGPTKVNHFTYDVYLTYGVGDINPGGGKGFNAAELVYSFSPLGPVNTSNRASDPEGPSVEMLTQLAEGSATQAAEELPGAVALEQNYPNPFNPSTAIRYELPAAEHVRLDVFDVSGRNVKVLVDGTRPAGTHTARFDAGGLPSGLYVYRLQAGGNTIVKTMHLIR